jgi:hypothetical protein
MRSRKSNGERRKEEGIKTKEEVGKRGKEEK